MNPKAKFDFYVAASYRLIREMTAPVPVKLAAGTAVDRDSMMEFVVDALATWDDDQVEQHLKMLQKRVKDLGDHEGLSPEDIELGCWAEALRELDEHLKSAAKQPSGVARS